MGVGIVKPLPGCFAIKANNNPRIKPVDQEIAEQESAYLPMVFNKYSIMYPLAVKERDNADQKLRTDFEHGEEDFDYVK